VKTVIVGATAWFGRTPRIWLAKHRYRTHRRHGSDKRSVPSFDPCVGGQESSAIMPA